MMETTKKIILSGNGSVGKTSIVNQYVRRRFLDKYPSTIGVRIDRTEIHKQEETLDLIIWDLVSEDSQHNTPQAHLIRVEGVIYVIDITEPYTYINMQSDILFLKDKLPEVPILVVANKIDKVPAIEVDKTIALIPIRPDIICSAKNALNIDEIFDRLACMMLQKDSNFV